MPIDGDVILKAALDTTNVEKSIEGLKGTIKKGFTTFLKYGLGVRSFFFLFRKLRKQVIDGMGNLAQVSQPFNTAMSSMQNALANLKSSFASAFAPIVQAVAPAITTFINLIANAVDAVGKLIAALTGQTTYVKYIATQQDYAQSVNETANSANKASKATDKANKSAKKYQKTLAGFDDVNILKDPNKDSDSSGGGSGSGGSGGKLSPVAGVINTPLSQVFTDLSTKLKEAWKNADFTEIGTIVGTKLKEALDNIPWTDIKITLWKIARSAATFLNGYFKTPGLFSSIGETIAQAFNSILIAVYTFVSTLNWKSIGSAVVEAIIGFFRTFNWKLFGATLYAWLKGLLTFLQGVVERIPWADIPSAVTGAITKFLEGFDWKDLINRTIGLIKSALDGLIEMISGKEGENKDSPLVKALEALKNAVGRIDATLFENLGIAIGKIVKALAPIAAGFGAGLIAFISGLVNIGVSVISTLGDALNAIGDALSKLDPEVLEKIGVALGIIAGAFVTLNVVRGIVTGLAGMISGIGAAASTAVAGVSGLSGSLGLAGLAGALGTATIALGIFSAALLGFHTTIATDEQEWAAYNEVIDDTASKISELGHKYGLTDEQIQQVSNTLSMAHNPVVTNASERYAQLDQYLQDNGVDVQSFKSGLAELVKTAGNSDDVAELSAYINDVGTSAKNADTDTVGLSKAFGLFSAPNFSAILKLALLKGAVDALGSSGKLSEEDTANLQRTLDKYDATPTEENMGKIQKAMEDAGVSAGDLNIAYIEAVKTLPKELRPEYQKLASTITTNNAQTKSKMESGGKDVVQGAIDGVTAKEKELSDKMASVVKDDIVGTFDSAADIQSPSKVMKLRGQYLLDGLKDGISSRTKSISDLIHTTIADMNKIITSFSNAFKLSGTTLMQNLYTAISGYNNSLSQLVSNISNNMLDSFDTESWSIVGHNAAVGMYNGFVALNGKLQQMVYRVASNMLAAAERALDIGSPSKKFAWIGEMTMLGLTGGIADNENQPVDAVADVADSLEKAASNTDLGATLDVNLVELLNTFDLILTDFSDIIIERFDNLIGSLAVLGTPAFANIPGVVQGKVVPTALNSSNSSDSEITNLRNAIDALNNAQLTRQDILDIVTTAMRNLPVNLYIGDEQVATHANRGNAIISRRFG